MNLLAYPTYRSRALGANTESLSGFVSNLNNSMMRCRLWVLCLLARSSRLACNSSLGESQINKLNRASGPSAASHRSAGQPDNRKLNEPSAMRQIRFNWTRLEEIFVCSAELQLYMELSAWSTGIVSGGCGKRGNPSCRGGGAAVCPSLGQGVPKTPLFCAILRDVIISSHMVNALVQEITAMEGGWQLRRPAERTPLITAAFLNCASLRDCQQDVWEERI